MGSTVLDRNRDFQNLDPWQASNVGDMIRESKGEQVREMPSRGLSMSAEDWELLKKELRKDADQQIAATNDQRRKDSIRADLTSFARLPVPSDDEIVQRRALATEYRAKWASAGKDSRMRDALFGRINEPKQKGD
jgi:hypothetical protein